MVSDGFCSACMKLPNPQEIPHVIHSNTKFFPFFKDALGAIDGSHLFMKPPSAIKACFHDHNGNLTQNMFAACNFDMFFMYVMTGWEGSAADSLLFQKAMVSSFDVPPGKYYVADAGFPNRCQLLVPYQNVCYHLHEWQVGSKQYVILLFEVHSVVIECHSARRTRRNSSICSTHSFEMSSSIFLVSSNTNSGWPLRQLNI